MVDKISTYVSGKVAQSFVTGKRHTLDSRETFLGFENEVELDDNSSNLDEEVMATVSREASGHLDPPIEDQLAMQAHQHNWEASPGNDSSAPGPSYGLRGNPALSQNILSAQKASRASSPSSLLSTLEQHCHQFSSNLAKR
uniref:Uncharacterized protein n=1 Tax=Sphaerodactylus townsendi TaxID=933632 RepID=A0ACB8FA16_9SAUR